MREQIDPLTGIKHYFPEDKDKQRCLSEKELRKNLLTEIEDDLTYFKNKLFNPMNFSKLKFTNDTITEFDDMEKFVGPLDAIAEVERLAPEYYQHVKDILESVGFVQSIPLNDKWMIHLKKAVMPTWKMVDIETLRPMEVKNVVVEFAIKVHLEDLFLKGDEWRVISDGRWHKARFTDKDEQAFEVML